MDGDPLYGVSWHEAFEQFVSSVEEYVTLELPADASPAERKLQADMKEHLILYKAAKEVEEKHDKGGKPV
jgi:hypothetical protein